MFRKSKVTLKGRWIITGIFLLTVLVPEVLVAIILAPKVPYPRIIIGRSLIRLLWAAPLYYFTMLGHAWARALTVLLLMISTALLISMLQAKGLVAILIELIVLITSTVILIGAKEVRPYEQRLSPRQRARSR